MIRHTPLARFALSCSALLLAAGTAAAQDLTITNVRIIGPNATVIERGSIVVRGGKIVSAAAGDPSSPAGKTIDAKGMTAMPGFIDAHRHFNTGPNEKAQMQAQLEAGYMPVNARTVWDAGAILGYCTDTTYDPKAGLEHELKSFNMMFSMRDMVKIMGPNTASYIQMADQLGTLEPGKLADIVLLDGDPLEGYWNWLKTTVVVKGGVVVVDKRPR